MSKSARGRRRWPALAGLLVALPALAQAQQPAVAGVMEEEPAFSFDWSFEAKAHVRDSEGNRYPSPERTSPAGTLGAPFAKVHQSSFLETVNEGVHFEVSTLTLYADATWRDAVTAHFKVDLIDLYDRNPTSTDKEIDVDEVWLRLGRESRPAAVPDDPGAYLRIGKFPKLERQNDRHLESYGVVATSFNRFEDAGVELGVDLGRWFYLKASATQGNPVFIRDPNALAGDNGVDSPPLHSGIPILYDAEVEDLDVDGDLELGGGLGWRWSNGTGRGVDLLAWGYQRDLAERMTLEGTIYPADLAFLLGPVGPFPLPTSGIEKRELGGNLWVYLGGFSLFAQYVDQDLAGIERRGYESEVAWRFEIPIVGLDGETPLALTPAVRYSRLDREIVGGSPRFAYPSVRSEWEKLDVGLRFRFSGGIDLTLEYADNRFPIVGFADAKPEGTNHELLGTLRWRT